MRLSNVASIYISILVLTFLSNLLRSEEDVRVLILIPSSWFSFLLSWTYSRWYSIQDRISNM